MIENSLNIGGSEWMIIIFVAVVLVLGTGKLPGAAKKMGKVVSEYNNAKNEIQQQMKEVTEEVPKILLRLLPFFGFRFCILKSLTK